MQDSELILHADQRLYHICLKDEDIADTVILVGDPVRVNSFSGYFSKTEYQSAHREFVAKTGLINGKRLTVLSTGIGTDNIDIVVNELDAAVNIDLHTKQIKAKKRQLQLIRLGTSGGIQDDLNINDLVCSTHGIGLDGLLPFYERWNEVQETDISRAFIKHTHWPENFPFPYCVSANTELLNRFSDVAHRGITATAPGFYGPQGRQLRLSCSHNNLNKLMRTFYCDKGRITNFEMETSALYGLGKLLGHHCLSMCVIIANRVTKKFTTNYDKSVQILIETCLQKLS